MKWMFLNTGYSSGEINMTLDEKLASQLFSERLDGVLRVYGWSPPCISLGYHQRLETLDLGKIRREGIGVVRRPTGGRTILHWEELTYSVVVRTEGRSLTQMYHHIGLALVCGLRRLNTEISLSRPDLRSQPLLRPTAVVPCYASIARYEIQYQGKKLVGSAQRKYSFPRQESSLHSGGFDECVLQHGSILIGPAHRRLVEFLAVNKESEVQALEKELEEKSTELSAILSRRVEFEEVAQCVRSGFEEEWGVHFLDALEEAERPLTVH
jgi:lipoate-protein ligase A